MCEGLCGERHQEDPPTDDVAQFRGAHVRKGSCICCCIHDTLMNMHLFIIIIIIIIINIINIRVHHVQKYTRAILPHAALSITTKLHCKIISSLGRNGSICNKVLFPVTFYSPCHCFITTRPVHYSRYLFILSPYYTHQVLQSLPFLHYIRTSAQYPPPLHFHIPYTPCLLFSSHATSQSLLPTLLYLLST